MSAIINASIDLSKIDTSKIYEKDGKKWLSISISVNDETHYGNNVGISIAQTKEERDAKKPKTYLGNGKVVWNSGTIVNAESHQQLAPEQMTKEEESNLPF